MYDCGVVTQLGLGLTTVTGPVCSSLESNFRIGL